MHLFNLPKELLINILEYMNYDQVAKARLVCKRFDQICQQILNRGFNKAMKQHSASFKRIKALLPRRESERRNHILARHADILTSMETRISMLSMTYGKFMDLNLCCFIPGRVLDEIFVVLRLIANSRRPLRPHEILQELRDISSMAIEHFDDKISGTLKKAFVNNNAKALYISSGNTDVNSLAATTGLAGISFRTTGDDKFNTYTYGTVAYMGASTSRNSGTTLYSKMVQNCPQAILPANSCNSGGCLDSKAALEYCKKLEVKYKKGCRKIRQMQRFQNEQAKRLQQTMASICEFKIEITELKKRMDEVDAKNREISANIKHISPTADDADSNAPTTSKLVNNSNTNSENRMVERNVGAIVPKISITRRKGIKRLSTEADNENAEEVLGNKARLRKQSKH